jgi:hypothetical protein
MAMATLLTTAMAAIMTQKIIHGNASAHGHVDSPWWPIEEC